VTLITHQDVGLVDMLFPWKRRQVGWGDRVMYNRVKVLLQTKADEQWQAKQSRGHVDRGCCLYTQPISWMTARHWIRPKLFMVHIVS